MFRNLRVLPHVYTKSTRFITYSPLNEFLDKIKAKGGFRNHHAHIDKAYTLNGTDLHESEIRMQEKWILMREKKKLYTPEDLRKRMVTMVEKQKNEFDVTKLRTHIDVDSYVGLIPMMVASELRDHYRKQGFQIQLVAHPLEGLQCENIRKLFVEACHVADCIGGLPSKDRPNEDAHLDYLMELAKSLNKDVEVHIDQENSPLENETELLARKTLEHGLEGRVRGVHLISLAKKPIDKQMEIIKLIKKAEMSVVVCPSAALSMRQLEDQHSTINNSIAPIRRLLEAGIKIGLGTDNVHDVFLPMVDGDMAVETRMLMETSRYYDIDSVVEMATSDIGFL